MVLNYSAAWDSLVGGNITSASVQAYTVSLGSWAWFLAIFITVIVVYIRTQSTAMALIVGLLFFVLAQTFVGLTGNTLFYTIIVLGLAILLFHFFWKD